MTTHREDSGETAIQRHARDYPAGAVLFREGEPGDDMYGVTVHDGRVWPV